MSDLVYESFDVSDACGSEFGVRLTAVWRSITHLPVGLDAAEFAEVALQRPLGSGAGAVDGGLYSVEVFGCGCIGSGSFEEGATAKAPGSLHEFADEHFFDGSVRYQAGVPGSAEFYMSLLFVRTEEGGGGEEAESGGVLRSPGFALGGDWASRAARIDLVGENL